jgi:4-amino-4-deoxy-L-arabinose transferase-like glycosyltransferase
MRSPAFTSPLEASIYVEGLRARPGFFVAVLLLAHAAIWTLVAWFANATPDPKITVGLALGREWQLGYFDTPPLAPWLLEIAYQVGGITAVYALGPLTVALTGWFVFSFARRIVGERHGALAMFLMVGVHPVAFPVGAFDSDIAQMPLVALAVLTWWVAITERSFGAWLLLGVTFGGLAYAGLQGLFVLITLVILTAASPQGRATLRDYQMQIAAVSALFIFTLLLTPRMIWLQNHGFAGATSDLGQLGDRAVQADALVTGMSVLFGHVGLLVLVVLGSRLFAHDQDIAPVFVRPPLGKFSRAAAIALALLPGLLALGAAFLFGGQYPAVAAAPLVLYSGLLVIVLSGNALRVHRQRVVAVAALTLLFLPPALELATAYALPWVRAGDRFTNWPAADAARYVTDVYRTRTGKPFEYIVGGAATASAMALASRDRPHVFIDADSIRSPWASRDKIETQGAIVAWQVRGANTAPPAALAANLPPLVAEAPLTLRWVRPGNMDFVRLGWAIIPPKPQ